MNLSHKKALQASSIFPSVLKQTSPATEKSQFCTFLASGIWNGLALTPMHQKEFLIDNNVRIVPPWVRFYRYSAFWFSHNSRPEHYDNYTCTHIATTTRYSVSVSLAATNQDTTVAHRKLLSAPLKTKLPSIYPYCLAACHIIRYPLTEMFPMESYNYNKHGMHSAPKLPSLQTGWLFSTDWGWLCVRPKR